MVALSATGQPVRVAIPDDRWPASDTLSQNEHYLGQRLLYQRAGEVEVELNDTNLQDILAYLAAS